MPGWGVAAGLAETLEEVRRPLPTTSRGKGTLRCGLS